jgi:tetratricopeptide (TPR) repeat protein
METGHRAGRSRDCARSQQRAQPRVCWFLEDVSRPKRGRLRWRRSGVPIEPARSERPWWQFYTCALHASLAHWEQAISWCEKSVANNPQAWYPLVGLAAANAWAGHDKQAKEAAAQLQKVYPRFTVQTWAGIHWTDDPTFNAQNQRIIEGLRKAGIPEGEAKTN